MPVTLARHSGYCAGVRKAMDMAEAAARAASAAGERIFALGDVIHNRLAVERLEKLGIVRTDSLDGLPRGASVILRSHGVPPEVMDECRARGLKTVDCTCAHVAMVHEIAREAAREGRTLFLIGEKDHPEVNATRGWCSVRDEETGRLTEGRCLVIPDEAAAKEIPYTEKAVAVAQTTFPVDKWDGIIRVLKERTGNLEIRRSICGATALRQEEAKRLAAESDCMIVVGSAHSANTRRLYESCRRLCERTCLVECAADLPAHFCDIHRDQIGITAGASTPDWLLKEVVTHMNDIEKDIAQEAPLTEEEQSNQDFMADVDKTLVRIHNGQTLEGTVVQISDDEVCVNIGYKSDGIIKREDLVDKDVKIDDKIEVEVVKVNDGEGNVLLSQRNIVNRKAWDALMEKYENGEYVEAVGKEAVKGGLIANVDGIRAFVPASRLAMHYVDKIAQFVGQPMKLKIIDVDKQKKRIVASRKDVLIEETAARKAAAWEKLEEGAVVKGIVRRFADFGAFVDLGGVDGLIHVTDLSWGHVNHPSDILTAGQEIEVKVLSLDRERERIQLGYKQLQPKPWDNIEEKYPVGVILERPVVRIRTFGAFIELEPGVDGLVHISQCALTRVSKVEDVLEVGQMVRVKVLGVDPEAKRISLSIREVLADEAMNDEFSMDIPGDEAAPAEGIEEGAEGAEPDQE